jgi:hypothetical protein
MHEFVFKVSIMAVVRVRAETEADARQVVISPALAPRPLTKSGWRIKLIS